MVDQIKQIVGVDFSGAGTNTAEGKTWLTSGVLRRNTLTLEETKPVSRHALAQLLTNAEAPTIAAMDFPFSVPVRFLEHWVQHDAKVATATTMPELWQSAKRLTGANTCLIDWCAKFKDEKGKQLHPKRYCEEHYPKSKSPMNKRMIPMTFRGMQMLDDVWRCKAKKFSIPNLLEGSPGAPVVLEVTPGLTLALLLKFHKAKLKKGGYKELKSGIPVLQNRRTIFEMLRGSGLLKINGLERWREEFLVFDDCIDSVLAAVTAALWKTHSGAFPLPPSEGEPQYERTVREGWMFVPQLAR